ncbi:MAG: amidase domain-containing protein [bacterium]
MMRLTKPISFLILFLTVFFSSTDVISYDKVTAERYLERYWNKNGPNGYNSPPFEDYSASGEGGDCANFGSQALIAGNILFKQKNVGFNLSQHKGAITAANQLRRYLEESLDAQVAEKGINETNTYKSFMQTGDITFWIHHYGDEDFHWDPPPPPHARVPSSDPRYGRSFNDYARHTLVINEDTGSDLLYSCHSGDLYRESLQNHEGGMWQTLYLRYLHLPDAPIIKYMEVTQVQEGRDTTVYDLHSALVKQGYMW